MTADVGCEEKKHPRLLLPVSVVVAVSLTIFTLLSFYLHTRMFMQSIAETSQIACGQAAQTIVYGLSYGKEISNYSGIDTLLGGTVELAPGLKNVYVCDTDGVIWGSHIKMMDNTIAMGKGVTEGSADKVSIHLEGKELHVLQSLDVEGVTVGFIGTVTEIKSVVQTLETLMVRELSFALVLSVLAVIVAVWFASLVKSPRLIIYLLASVLYLLPAVGLHLYTQHNLLDAELIQQSKVMVATINADATRLAEKGIEVGSTVGFDRYLTEKLAGQETISLIKLENKLNGEQYSARTAENTEASDIREYNDSPFFNISVGLSDVTYKVYRQRSIVSWMSAMALTQVAIALAYALKKKVENS